MTAVAPALVVPSGNVLSVDVARLEPGRHRGQDLGRLNPLRLSIRRHGVLAPLLVHAPRPGCLEILDGDRRWYAARAVGLDTVPAVLLARRTPAQAKLVALAANMHHAPLPVAARAQLLLDLFGAGYHSDTLGEQLGLHPMAVVAMSQGMRLVDEVHESTAGGAPTWYPPASQAAAAQRPSPVPAPRIAPSAVHSMLTRLGDRMEPAVRAELEALLRGWTPPTSRQVA